MLYFFSPPKNILFQFLKFYFITCTHFLDQNIKLPIFHQYRQINWDFSTFFEFLLINFFFIFPSLKNRFSSIVFIRLKIFVTPLALTVVKIILKIRKFVKNIITAIKLGNTYENTLKTVVNFQIIIKITRRVVQIHVLFFLVPYKLTTTTTILRSSFTIQNESFNSAYVKY